ncbi:MAG: NAD(P)/FAD-dependent oxidoreductase [Desulfovibrio sp.]
MKSKTLLLAGAGHAHLTVMHHISQIRALGHNVIVVGPEPYHFYSGMGPGMLGGDYTAEDVRFPVRKMVESRGGTFIQDKIVHIDPEAKKASLQSGIVINYDVASFNTGSGVPPFDGADPDGVYAVKPVENLLKARKHIQQIVERRTVKIGVIGGGPAALEIAGNAWAAADQKGGTAEITIYGGRTFLKAAPYSVYKRAMQILKNRNIKVVEGGYVTGVDGKSVLLRGRKLEEQDILFTAVGVKPSSFFKDSGIPTGGTGGMEVNEFLQSTKYPNLFGGGDCIHFEPQPLAKVGVYAVRQNPILLKNILAALEDTSMESFSPGGSYLLIFNMGKKEGIFHKDGFVFGGRIAFWIKDYIDRKFMKDFKK